MILQCFEGSPDELGIIRGLAGTPSVDVADNAPSIQHDHEEAIFSTAHVHLDHHYCLEVLIVRGKTNVIRKIDDEHDADRGVKFGKPLMTTTRKELPS